MAPTLSKHKIAAFCIVLHTTKKKRKHRFWMRDWYQERQHFNNSSLLCHLRISDEESNHNYFRMTQNEFDYLLSRVEPYLKKQDTFLRKSIPVKAKLQATLRFLATGSSYEELKFSYGISPQSLGRIIPDTCKAIFSVLQSDFMKFPQSEEDWYFISSNFEKRWNFPHCLGSIDGKHIAIKRPTDSGSDYFNYKKFYSIILMAIVNANYEFIMVDVGKNGRAGDGGVINETEFYNKLTEGKLKIPKPDVPPGGTSPLLYCFVADDAFSLGPFLMKPYSHETSSLEEKIFNYRTSRARRTVENAFGILTARFRVLHTTIQLEPSKVTQIVLACCVLHNFLRRKCKNIYTPNGFIDYENVDSGVVNLGNWRTEDNSTLVSLMKSKSRKSKLAIKAIRDKFKMYFMNGGQVSWQNDMV